MSEKVIKANKKRSSEYQQTTDNLDVIFAHHLFASNPRTSRSLRVLRCCPDFRYKTAPLRQTLQGESEWNLNGV